MTAVRSPASVRVALPAGAALAIGCALLTARPLLVGATPRPTAVLAGIFVLLAAVGLALPVPAAPTGTPTTRPRIALLVGVAVFAVGRALSGGMAVGPVTVGALTLHSLAAISEEIWFRRVVFGWLAPAGRVLAICGSAALFAAVHVTTYGAWILPLDLAAGLVFAWQRDTTGSWRVPAVTHVVANVLAVL